MGSSESALPPRACSLSVDLYLQLREREATACPHTAVVFDGGAADDGSELVDWAGSYGSSFGETGIATS